MLALKYYFSNYQHTNQPMSKVKSIHSCTLQSYFRKMNQKLCNSSLKQLEEDLHADQQLQMMLIQAKDKGYSQHQSTYCEFSKQNTTFSDAKSVLSTNKSKKMSILEYCKDNSTTLASNQRSRSRDKRKKTKKTQNTKKADKSQLTLQKFYPNFTMKFSEPAQKKKQQKQKQLTLQFFCKQKRKDLTRQ